MQLARSEDYYKSLQTELLQQNWQQMNQLKAVIERLESQVDEEQGSTADFFNPGFMMDPSSRFADPDIRTRNGPDAAPATPAAPAAPAHVYPPPPDDADSLRVALAKKLFQLSHLECYHPEDEETHEIWKQKWDLRSEIGSLRGAVRNVDVLTELQLEIALDRRARAEEQVALEAAMAADMVNLQNWRDAEMALAEAHQEAREARDAEERDIDRVVMLDEMAERAAAIAGVDRSSPFQLAANAEDGAGDMTTSNNTQTNNDEQTTSPVAAGYGVPLPSAAVSAASTAFYPADNVPPAMTSAIPDAANSAPADSDAADSVAAPESFAAPTPEFVVRAFLQPTAAQG